jgi:hypothetical protein
MGFLLLCHPTQHLHSGTSTIKKEPGGYGGKLWTRNAKSKMQLGCNHEVKKLWSGALKIEEPTNLYSQQPVILAMKTP